MSVRRSANTCAECRVRKVKCDGRREVCVPCERLQLRCSFRRTEDGAEAHPDPQALIGIRRAQVACTACQALKVRCGGERPQCQRCTSKGAECIYQASKRDFARNKNKWRSTQSPRTILSPESPLARETLPTTEATPRMPITPDLLSHAQIYPSSNIPKEVTAVSSTLDNPTVMRLLEGFFQHIQPIPIYSFFHKASLIHRFEAGLLNPSLMLALIGTTCEMLEMDPSLKEIGETCLSRSETLVMENVVAPSAVKIQALILIIRAHCRQGRTTPAFVLFAIASRFAYALRLNHEAPNLCFLEQESRRRLMWSLLMVDMALAGGIRELSLCPAESIYLQLPCQVDNFDLDLKQETEPLKPVVNQLGSASIGSLGAYVRVQWLRYRVLQTTKEAVLSQGNAVEKLPSRIKQLAEELAEFEARLPLDLQYSKRNLQLRAYSTRLCPYVLMHIWLRQCYCDLYRVVLTGLKEALRKDQIQQLDQTLVKGYREKCFHSCKELSKVLGDMPVLKGKFLTMDADIQICAYQCVRLLLQCFRLQRPSLEYLTQDTLYDLISQCVAAVEAIPSNSPTGQLIERDFRKMLRRGRSAEPSPERGNISVGSASSRLFSRHSFIGQMNVQDDSSDLIIRDGVSRDSSHLSSSAELRAQVSPVLADTEDGITSHSLDSPRHNDLTDFNSFTGFQGDFGDPFYIDPTNMDLFGWSGDFLTNTAT